MRHPAYVKGLGDSALKPTIHPHRNDANLVPFHIRHAVNHEYKLLAPSAFPQCNPALRSEKEMLTIRSNQTVPTIAIIRQGKQGGIVHQIGIMPSTVHRSSVVVAAVSHSSSPEAPDLWVLDLQPS